MEPIPKILVTDDVAANRIAMRKLLRRHDVEVLEASDGNQALQLALTEPDIALALLDVQMPQMTGYEVATLLRQENRTHHIPIIFLTAVARDERNELNGYKSGGVDYIHKPIDAEILLAKVAIFVEMWRMNSRLHQEVAFRREAEEKIRHLAKHDMLTRLPNRSQLLDNINQGVARVDRYGGKLSVLFLDLDGFKPVNDIYGHEAGDFVLKEIASRLRNMMRPTDTVARFGGDEFVILMTDVQDRDCIIPKLQAIISTCAKPIHWLNHKLELSISLGVSMYPGNGADAAELIKSADSAMYRAKEAGKNCFRFVVDGQSESEKQYKAMSAYLERALEMQEMFLLYQPIHCVETLEVVAAEALLRWQHPELGMIEPATFVPVAESSGVIDRIGDWVITEALSDSLRWWNETQQKVRVMVNVATAQISENGFSGNVNDFLSPVLATVGESVSVEELDEFLGVEVKEKILARPFDSVKQQLGNLKQCGIGVSVDNVGADVSALNYLKNNLASQLKIDRAVIKEVPGNEAQEKIVRSVMAIAHIFDMKVIATGVESKEQYDFLRDIGCDYVQGFYFSPAISNEEFKTYICGSSELESACVLEHK
ncbi:EAL domain-containing protein [uncultured Pseudoteredinibacter sp.]|uniref:putative bifunctional diguanylate cyclase/phosphodiesterase n=1 Tax=uncultured Pseudoteredinibacter sp. TaxID=1641701 RepID=UPI002625CA0F|nr:EAL domain-containing protein [uncultured Pseudoteredinibacter sp.]